MTAEATPDTMADACIAVAGDLGYFPRIATLLLNLRTVAGGGDDVDVRVITDARSFAAGGAELGRVAERIGYRPGHGIDFCTVDDAALAGLGTANHLSTAAYLRLWIPDVVTDHRRCLYLDSDIMVRRPLGPLLETDLQGRLVAALFEDEGEKERLGLEASPESFNSGVMLIDVAGWREFDVQGKCLRWAAAHRETIRWCDQDALNVVLDGRVIGLEPRWNYMPQMLHLRLADPEIVHFSTSAKPWHYGMHHPFRDEYRDWMRRLDWPKACLEHGTWRNRVKDTAVGHALDSMRKKLRWPLL